MYYTLIVKVDGVWCIDFGDYDRKVVEDERQDRRDNDAILSRNMKIIATLDDQESINAAVNEWNNGC